MTGLTGDKVNTYIELLNSKIELYAQKRSEFLEAGKYETATEYKLERRIMEEVLDKLKEIIKEQGKTQSGTDLSEISVNKLLAYLDKQIAYCEKERKACYGEDFNSALGYNFEVEREAHQYAKREFLKLCNE